MTTQVTAVTNHLTDILSADTATHTVGILMTNTYGPANTFVQGVKNWLYANDAQQMAPIQKAARMQIYFSNVSFVGPNSLASRLVTAGQVTTPTGPQPYTTGVFVSQVVPNYDSDNSQVVLDYKRLLGTSAAPTFTALEGYIVGRVFVEGLKTVQGPINADTMIPAFENLSVGALGLGASAGFSSTKHQYSQTVYGTEIGSDGHFINRYFWSDGSPIQLFQ